MQTNCITDIFMLGWILSTSKQEELNIFSIPCVTWHNYAPDVLNKTASSGPPITTLGAATWSDEDFVGRCSRISRKTHSFTTTIRTIQRALMHYQRQFDTLEA